ncbi:MAG: hypothetical protein HUU55_11375 [Myxococcales bacterium]|nr:hypothetical protein [Myxococcales bacterium]
MSIGPDRNLHFLCAVFVMSAAVGFVLPPSFLLAKPTLSPSYLICVEFESTTCGFHPADLIMAIRVEGRKAGTDLIVRDRAHTPACSATCVQVFVDGIKASVSGPSTGETVLMFAPIEPIDRAPRLAELVASTAAKTDPTPEFLLSESERSDPNSMRPVLNIHKDGSIETTPEVKTVRINAILGGKYAYFVGPELHLGGAEAALEAALFRGALSFRLSGAWIPSQSTRTSPNAFWSAGELGMTVYGGFRWDAVLFRAGLTLGWEWRTLEVDSTFRFNEPEMSASVPWIGGEVELSWPVVGLWWMGFAAGGRGYPAGDTLDWAEQPWMSSVAGAVSITLRTGVTLW